MRTKFLTSIFLCAFFSGLMACHGEQEDPGAPAAETHNGTYSTTATTIGTLMDDPAARAVIDRHVPGFSEGPMLRLVRGTTLKGIQGYGADVLTDAVLAHIDADLATLTPQLSTAQQTRRTPNFDEAKVPPYHLPDPLRLENGDPVTDAQIWWQQRRPEILDQYASLVYGHSPDRPADQWFEIRETGEPALDGSAIRKQVSIHFSAAKDAPTIHLVEYLPAEAPGPVPVLLMIQFLPAASIVGDSGLPAATAWHPATHQRVAVSELPAVGDMPPVDIKPFLAAGFGVATYYYGDVEPDFEGGSAYGVRGLIEGSNTANPSADSWGAIAAWSWSLSRVQDYLETDPDIDARRVAIYGASRLGKAALWAAARDQRFAAVIACCSGKLGGALLRRNYGEPIYGSNGGNSAYWTAGNLGQFHDREAELPVDSHMLLGLIAPRPVLLQTGALDHAADPKGEYLAAVAATPVYQLLGGEGLDSTDWPPERPMLGDLGYYMHEGGHGTTAESWSVYLSFLQQHLDASATASP